MFSDWTRGEILALIVLPFVAIATFANAAALQSAFQRRLLVSASAVVSIVVTGAVLWMGQPNQRVVTPPRRPTPARTPAKKEIPAPAPAPAPATFIVEPSDPHAWKSAYCLVADFEGSLVPNADKIDATIIAANFDLCRFSKHSSRQIRIRVGVEISGRPTRWSPRTMVARPGAGPQLLARKTVESFHPNPGA